MDTKHFVFMFANINLPKIRIQENTLWKMLTRVDNSFSRMFHSLVSSHKSQKKTCFSSDNVVFFAPSDIPLLFTFLQEAFRVVFPWMAFYRIVSYRKLKYNIYLVTDTHSHAHKDPHIIVIIIGSISFHCSNL